MKEKYDIRNYVALKKRDTIVVGCSTGADSMALLSMLLEVRDMYQLNIVCAHVNHNVRAESVMEEEYIESFARSHNLFYEEMTIKNYGDDNFENEARNIRYQFFRDVVLKYQARLLMTAHHGDDLIETILMKIVRGSNLNGYAGFKKYVDMRDFMIVRPLISFTKEELIQYDEMHHIKYFEDKSNHSLAYTRNRYRKKILPFLKQEDPNVHQKFLKMSQVLQEVSNYVVAVRDKELKKVLKNGRLDIDSYLELDPFIQKEILYYLMQEFYQDDLILINDKHIDLVYNLIKSKKSNARVSLPNEVLGIKSYQFFYLEKEMDELVSYEIELDCYAKLPNGHVIKKIEDTVENSNFICRLSSKDVVFPLIVRTRKVGDKMVLKGVGGTKKLKDIFIDGKITIKKRDMWPVVVDSLGRVVWVPGLKKSKFDKKKSEKYDIILEYC